MKVRRNPHTRPAGPPRKALLDARCAHAGITVISRFVIPACSWRGSRNSEFSTSPDARFVRPRFPGKGAGQAHSSRLINQVRTRMLPPTREYFALENHQCSSLPSLRKPGKRHAAVVSDGRVEEPKHKRRSREGYTTPYATMALATLMKPAILAPTR
jgi:hypothetical protein